MSFEPNESSPQNSEALSPEQERRSVISSLEQKDTELKGNLLTKIPTANGVNVLILKQSNNFKTNKEANISAFGYHPDLGPIVITAGPLGWEINERKQGNEEGRELEGNSWEELVKNAERKGPQERSEKQFESRVRTIMPEEQPDWDYTLEDSVNKAIIKFEAEAAQEAVLKQTTSSVQRILEKTAAPQQPAHETPTELPTDLRPAPEEAKAR